MTPAVFEPSIPASELPLTQALYSATTGICKYPVPITKMYSHDMHLISFDVNLLNYLERFENHHDRLRMNKCCKMSTKYTIKTYFSVLPFLLKSSMMLERRTV